MSVVLVFSIKLCNSHYINSKSKFYDIKKKYTGHHRYKEIFQITGGGGLGVAIMASYNAQESCSHLLIKLGHRYSGLAIFAMLSTITTAT